MRRQPILWGLLLAIALMAGCSGTQDVLEPSAIAPAPPVGSAASAVEGQDSAAVPSPTRLRIDPIVGTSVEAAIPLVERLATGARAHRIAIAGSADTSATHVLKGYFSAVPEGDDTIIVYVWDIYDPAGNRLHRISGRQKAPGRGGGWSAASPEAMQAIADATITLLSDWFDGHAGGTTG